MNHTKLKKYLDAEMSQTFMPQVITRFDVSWSFFLSPDYNKYKLLFRPVNSDYSVKTFDTKCVLKLVKLS